MVLAITNELDFRSLNAALGFFLFFFRAKMGVKQCLTMGDYFEILEIGRREDGKYRERCRL